MTDSMLCQQTLARPAEVCGRGYWSGEPVRVEFRPAAPGTGIVFVRGDLEEHPRVPALVGQRVEVPRRTNLVCGPASVSMVEHLLAALAGLRIDNCEVWVDREEMPADDGSSAAFVEALQQAGLAPQPIAVEHLEVTHRVRVGDGDAWVEANPSPRGAFELRYDLDYGEASAIGRQSLTLQIDPASFRSELASARTFLREEEAQWLRAQGLGRHIDYRDILVFGRQGPIDNALRFDDECVRHKMLDMVGDLALAGCRLRGRFHAYRSGHRLNAELVAALLDAAQGRRASA